MRVLEFLKQDLDDPIKFASLVRRQMVKFGFHCVDVSAQVKGKRDGSSSQGLKITAPLWRVSFTLRVTRKRSCSIAVAARKVSMTGGACRVLRLTSPEITPQRKTMASSTESSRSLKRCASASRAAK